ncbi:MAG TPA: CBS domain-containing protein [Blastocatellia bacterium]|nr:CBS domain-containing protein [Blastocatellia bacterium]
MNTLHSIIRGRETWAISPKMTALEAAEFMAGKRIGAAPVVEGDRLVGVFSERDLMTRVVVAGRDPHQTLIAEVMTRNVVTGRPDESYTEGMRRMQQARCRHLPIVEDGSLLGFVSLRDLLQNEIEEKNEELRFMNEYLHSMPASQGR